MGYRRRDFDIRGYFKHTAAELSTPHIGFRYAAILSTVITARELKFSLVMNIV